VFYQPTPARHIFALMAAISANEVLVDLGSGLGHVPLLVSACTGARCIGIELDPGRVASSRQCAEKLNLDRVSFLEQDAREADLSAGAIFYLYTPFTGSILRTVLNSLRNEAAARPIKVCTFGPCTRTVANEPWLQAKKTPPETDRIEVFLSRP
jgi:predicted RNA methylase